MKTHLFSRNVNGKRRWYFWFYDETGSRKRLTTGCTRKADAERFVEEYQEAQRQQKTKTSRMTFATYVADFFAPESPYVERWRSHGHEVKASTLKAHAAYVRLRLLPWFADLALKDITARALDEKLLKLDCSGSQKNNIRDTLSIILKEARFDGLIKDIPVFVSYARNSRRQEPLSSDELRLLFPFDPERVAEVWSIPADRYNAPNAGQMFFTMAAIAVSGGLRSGEIRALSYEQVIEGRGIIVDRMLDLDQKISLPKKGRADDLRHRVVPLPDFTLQLLERWLDIRGRGPGLLFTSKGNPIRKEFLASRFEAALENIGIDTAKRRTTFHALRYTYNTRMKNAIPREMLRDIIGHRTDEMTDLYDRPELKARLDEYREQIMPAVNGFWK